MFKEAFNSIIMLALRKIKDVKEVYGPRPMAPHHFKRETPKFNLNRKLLTVGISFARIMLKLREDEAKYLLEVLATYTFYRGRSEDRFSTYLGELGACWMARRRFLSLNVAYGDLEARRKLVEALNHLPLKVLGERYLRALKLSIKGSTSKELGEEIGKWPEFKEDRRVGLAVSSLRGVGGIELLKEIVDSLNFKKLSFGGVYAFLLILLNILPMESYSWFSLKERLIAKLKPHSSRIDAVVGGGFINLIRFLERKSWEDVFIHPMDDDLKDAIAMAEESIPIGPEGLFSIDDLNVILEFYLRRKLGVGKKEFRGGYVDRRMVEDKVLKMLYNERFILYLNLLRRLKGHPDVDETFLSEHYLNRVAQLTIEELAGESLAYKPLKICIKPLTASEAAEHLKGEVNMAIICGAMDNLFQNTLWDMAQDSFEYSLSRGGVPLINILGVHKDWLLVSNGRLMAERSLLVDSNGGLREARFTEPQTIHACLILNLPLKHEHRLHEELSSQISRLRVPLINPYPASRRAESKLNTHKLIEKFNNSSRGKPIHSPRYEVVTEGSLKRILASVKGFLNLLSEGKGREKPLTFIVKPDRGTEGLGVEGFSVEASSLRKMGEGHEAIRYIHRLLKVGGVLIEDCRGDVRYEGRRVSFRFNVSWNGSRFLVESGFAQIAKDEGTFVTSPSRGGRIININVALRSLQLPKENRVIRCEVGEDELKIMEDACIAVAEALNIGLREKDFLKYMGIDFVLDAEEVEGKVKLTPIILEANPRPSGLTYLRKVIGPQSREDGEANIFKNLLSYVEVEAKRYKESVNNVSLEAPNAHQAP